MLTGKEIRLRPLKVEDIEKTNIWRNDQELIKLTMGLKFPKTLEMDKEWFHCALNDKSNRNIYLGIDELISNNFIGIIQICNIDWISKICELGIVIGDKNMQGKGYGTEAMSLLFGYAFYTLNLRKILLHVVSLNDNAKTLYDKLGFREEGRLSKHFFVVGDYHDIYILSLFKEDFIIK